jgi:hypothetical protein
MLYRDILLNLATAGVAGGAAPGIYAPFCGAPPQVAFMLEGALNPIPSNGR